MPRCSSASSIEEGCGLEFVNAGHLPPLLLRAGEVDEPFTEGGFPVGLIPDASYVASCVALRPWRHACALQ